MKNFLLFTLEYPPFKGGIANYYYQLVNHWPQKNNIFVLNNNNGDLLNNNLLFLKWLPAVKTLKKEIKKNKIDYILVGNILPLGTASWLLSFFINFKYAVIIHGTDIAYAQKSKRKKWLAKMILNKADTIICNSSYVAKLIKELNKDFSQKIVVANPGVEKFSGSIKYPDKKLVNNNTTLFSISRLIRRKGVDKVIEVLPEITKKFPNLIYVVAGAGEDEKFLKKLAKNQKNIVFLNEISEEEKWGWLEVCDIFIQPTREEDGNFDGFGIVYLEANLAGKPVIAGDSGGVGDAVENGLNGLLVDPNDKEDIKNAIIKLIEDKKMRQKIGEQGKKRAQKEFSWSDKIYKIYNFIK